MPSFFIHKDVTAFQDKTIGSKVVKKAEFLTMLNHLVETYDTPDKVPGQHVVVFPFECYEYVSGGDGKKTQNPDDYVIRSHREGPKMFLKREHAGDVNFLAAIVYTQEAFIADPDCTPEEEAHIREFGAVDADGNLPGYSHAIVAVIASSAPESPVSAYRFVHNLAGGNNEYTTPVKQLVHEDVGHQALIKQAVNKAKEIKAHTDTYSVVAD